MSEKIANWKNFCTKRKFSAKLYLSHFVWKFEDHAERFLAQNPRKFSLEVRKVNYNYKKKISILFFFSPMLSPRHLKCITDNGAHKRLLKDRKDFRQAVSRNITKDVLRFLSSQKAAAETSNAVPIDVMDVFIENAKTNLHYLSWKNFFPNTFARNWYADLTNLPTSFAQNLKQNSL